MAFLEKIEQHPYLTGAVVFVIGAAIVIFMRSGGAPAAPSTPVYSTSPVQSGTDLQQAQLAAQAQQSQLDAQLQASENHDASAIALAQIAATVATNGQNSQADTINKQTTAQVMMSQAGYASQDYANSLMANSHNLDSTLSAQVREAELATSLQSVAYTTAASSHAADVAAAASAHAADVTADAYSNAARIAAEVSIDQINANASLQSQQIASTLQQSYINAGVATHAADLTASIQNAMLALSSHQLDVNQNIAEFDAATQEHISNFNAATQEHIASINAGVTQSQIALTQFTTDTNARTEKYQLDREGADLAANLDLTRHLANLQAVTGQPLLTH